MIPKGRIGKVHIAGSIEPTHHNEMRVAVEVNRDNGALQGEKVVKAQSLVAGALEASGFYEPLHVQEREAAATFTLIGSVLSLCRIKPRTAVDPTKPAPPLTQYPPRLWRVPGAPAGSGDSSCLAGPDPLPP
jgi:hypothetical protein